VCSLWAFLVGRLLQAQQHLSKLLGAWCTQMRSSNGAWQWTGCFVMKQSTPWWSTGAQNGQQQHQQQQQGHQLQARKQMQVRGSAVCQHCACMPCTAD
jgi:hypothetical protein